jgi:hypothetical protein
MHVAVVLQSWSLLVERVRMMLNGAWTGTMDLLLAVLVVAVGWLLSLLVARLLLWILRTARFNEGVRGMLGEGAPPLKHEPALIAARAAQGTVIVLAVMLAADALGFELSSSVGDRLREVLPRVVSASIVLVVGVAVAMMVGGAAGRLFVSAGVRTGRARGQIVTVVLTAFTILLSLEQLGLAAQFIIALGLTAIAAVGLGLALAFGLGCRELARDFVVEYLRSLDEERPGRPS